MKKSAIILGIGAFAAPLVASEVFTGNLAGDGQFVGTGKEGQLKSLALGAGLLVGLYGLLAESEGAAAVGGGLVVSSLSMMTVFAPEKLQA